MNLGPAIGAIIGLSILFFVCGLLCYCIFNLVCREEVKELVDPTITGWDAKHYYDPPPSVFTPPETMLQPSLYSFKVNKNGSHHHAVINPAVLQTPPGPHRVYPEQMKNQHQPIFNKLIGKERTPKRDQQPLFLSDVEDKDFYTSYDNNRRVFTSNGYYNNRGERGFYIP